MIFPELHVLHLPERIDREELFMREFCQQGIATYRIWPGIKHDVVFAGISAAHKQIVRYAKTVGLKSIVICEDDIKFTHPTSFEYYLKNTPEDFDLYLGSVYMGTLNPDNTVDDFSGLTLYTVHERYYDKFLATPQMNHIDRAQAEQDPDNPAIRKPRGIFKVCYPYAAIQYLTFSNQHNSVVDHRVWLQGRRLYNGMP